MRRTIGHTQRKISRRAVVRFRQAFGLRLRELRRRQRLTQTGLGEAAGLSGKFIGEVERGQKSISLDSLYRLARASNVSLKALVGFTPPKEGSRGPTGLR
jgi:transcriptional regulator with XRE-family HTH domain